MIFNFMRWRWLYFVISACFLLPGMLSLVLFGLRPSIDFTGGSLLEVRFQSKTEGEKIDRNSIQKSLGATYEINNFQKVNDSQIIMRGKPISNEEKNALAEKLQNDFKEVNILRFETVGPVLGKELVQKTMVAGVIVALIIILYISQQFHELKYGVAAVLAMLHDAFIVIGAFSLLGKFMGVEVDVLFVTAVLTILSFSVHDTIIVFDRIREIVRQHPAAPYQDVVNAAVLQTLGRSINNSMTIIIMLLALVLLGGETIRWFAVALLIGAITGTYSSTFNAAPLLLVWDDVARWRRQQKK